MTAAKCDGRTYWRREDHNSIMQWRRFPELLCATKKNPDVSGSVAMLLCGGSLVLVGIQSVYERLPHPHCRTPAGITMYCNCFSLELELFLMFKQRGAGEEDVVGWPWKWRKVWNFPHLGLVIPTHPARTELIYFLKDYSEKSIKNDSRSNPTQERYLGMVSLLVTPSNKNYVKCGVRSELYVLINHS